MGDSQEKITLELNRVAVLVEDYCLTPETSTSEAVEGVILSLKESEATVARLKHQLMLLERQLGQQNSD